MTSFFFFFRWILSYFRLADKDRSGTLTKRECRRLLTDSLNAKVPEAVFEKLFQVKSIDDFWISIPLDRRKQIKVAKVFSLPMNSSISFMLLLVERISMKSCKSQAKKSRLIPSTIFSSFRYVKNGDRQSIETISMTIEELLYFLRFVQNVSQSLIVDRSIRLRNSFSKLLSNVDRRIWKMNFHYNQL